MHKWVITTGVAIVLAISTVCFFSRSSTPPPQQSVPVALIDQSKTKCAVLGDSIALGTGWALQKCEVHALVGAPGGVISSWQVPFTGTLIVSIGSNNSPDLENDLTTVVSQARGAKIIFILPALPGPRGIVQRFATKNKIATVDYTPGGDGVHPRNYGEVATKLKRFNWF